MDVPTDLSAILASGPPQDQVTTEELWIVVNDEEFLEPRFASGEIHPLLREKIMEPMYFSPIPGPAKRYMLWTNEGRANSGAFIKEGWAVLKVQTVARTPFRTVTGAELEEIDEGRRPNG